ncbi:MAG: hypothetical protein LBF22_02275 [Deltaproteobacteria bacterium]|jgi:hypothetical protein|nr:hypothetical protein [Deltaproteobacteria bacterium]
MAEEKLREGIYLQTKKSTIGTGSTAKHAEYRNFWVTLSIGETHVEMILLDDSFMLTGIREKFTFEEVTGANWLFVEQGAKKYSQLQPRLSRILNPPPKPGTNKPASGKPGAPPAAKKDGWWSK